MGIPGLNQDFGSKKTVNVQRVVEPVDAVNELVLQNQRLKAANASWETEARKWEEEKAEMRNEMKNLAQFKQILKNPIEKIAIEFNDDELLRQIRGRMIQMFGRGGEMDAEGRWAQTVVNNRLKMFFRQLVFNGLQHWPQVKAQLDEIIKTQALMG